MEHSKESPKVDNKYDVNLKEINQKIDSIQDSLNTRGREIDSLQLERHKKKRWAKNPSNIISVLAVVLSVFATVYSINQEERKGEAQTKQRVKEIVKRINEIQSSFIGAGELTGAKHQAAGAELSTLLVEALEISRQNSNFLNDAEYLTLANTAFFTNKTNDIEYLIDQGLSRVKDIATEYALLNQQAKYHYELSGKLEMGRASIQKVIERTKVQQVSPSMKTANIALEYYYWSNFEFSLGNYHLADSTLEIAENLVLNTPDSIRYENYPVVLQLKNARRYFNQKVNTEEL